MPLTAGVEAVGAGREQGRALGVVFFFFFFFFFFFVFFFEEEVEKTCEATW